METKLNFPCSKPIKGNELNEKKTFQKFPHTVMS